MLNFETSLVELKSRRAQYEIQQIGLRRRLGELEREGVRVEEARRRGEADSQAVFEVRDRRAELSAELERLEGLVCELDDRIARVERGDMSGTVDHLVVASLQASGELDRVRTEILDTLRSLAGPLEAYEQLAERQRSLTTRIREATGKDNSYAAYIDTALLRTADYDDQLQMVVELIKRARVVS
jgi:chromosome segregation ATPase